MIRNATTPATALLLAALVVAPVVEASTMSSSVVQDGATSRTRYELWDSSHNTSLSYQSTTVTSCLTAFESNAESDYISASVMRECAPFGLVQAGVPTVRLFSADVQKAGPCQYANGQCLTGVVMLSIHGQFAGTIVLRTGSPYGEPTDAISLPVPLDSYENIIVTMTTRYARQFTISLNVIGSAGQQLLTTTRYVSVTEQPATAPKWVASAEERTSAGLSTMVSIIHASPAMPTCVRVEFQDAPAFESTVPAGAQTIVIAWYSSARPMSVRAGPSCDALGPALSFRHFL